jgi:uncharacterized protein YcfJ
MWVKSIAAVAAFGLGAGNAALADGHYEGRGNGQRDYAYGRVVDVQPLVRDVIVTRPRQQCWDDVAREPVHPFGVAGPTIAGGVVGAAIGRQFGSGSGRDALTLIGAVLGSAVANQRAVEHGAGETREVPVQRCEVVAEQVTERRVDGYLVTYVYAGRRYTMQTATPPGDRVRLAIDVHPVRNRSGF